ncbi:flagellar brake protein [Vibrio taketomensis]|uniref:flagellar brake protein n=1 Tax=Vibrio taketomensis TaxID=2572923 RepID=UPI001389C2D2|nr:flagellar brake protein [Vibrio taketomensis]
MPNENVELLIPYLKPNLKLSVKLEFGPIESFTFSSNYIGCKPNHYLIVEFPKKAQEALVMRQISNVEVIVRALTQSKLGHIIAFKSSVLGTVVSPAGIMFLRMPKHFASKPIRTHERYPLNLSIDIKSNTISYQAEMLDFSINGCAIFIKGENTLALNDELTIESDFSHLLPESLKFSIVSIEKQKRGHRFGVKFNQTIEMSTELKQFLLEQSFSSTPI